MRYLIRVCTPLFKILATGLVLVVHTTQSVYTVLLCVEIDVELTGLGPCTGIRNLTFLNPPYSYKGFFSFKLFTSYPNTVHNTRQRLNWSSEEEIYKKYYKKLLFLPGSRKKSIIYYSCQINERKYTGITITNAAAYYSSLIPGYIKERINTALIAVLPDFQIIF